MASPDPEHFNAMKFIVSNTAEIVTGATIVLLTVLKVLGRKEPAQAAQNILKDNYVSHYEVDAKLLSCQMKVTETINRNFEELRNRQDSSNSELRKSLMQEIKELHTRLNKEVRQFEQRSN